MAGFQTGGFPIWTCPSFPVLSLFSGKRQGKPPKKVEIQKRQAKPPKKARIFIPAEPLKSLEKKGNPQKYTQGKNKEFPKSKERKDRVFCPLWDFPDFSGIFPICPGTVRGYKHKLFGPVGFGTTPGLSLRQTRLVPGTNPSCPLGKPGFLVILHSGNPVCPRDKPSLSMG